jgi:hypothetical protein
MGVIDATREDTNRRAGGGTLKNPTLNHKTCYHEIIGMSSKKCKRLKGKQIFG